MIDEYGCAYVAVADRPVARTVQLCSGVFVDVDVDGMIVGVELMNCNDPACDVETMLKGVDNGR